MEPVLILFAKKPVAGQVKTRLSPPLTAIQAQEVAELLIQLSLQNVAQHWPGAIELSLRPDFEDDFIQTIAQQYNCGLTRQSAGNLGDKMYTALAAKLTNRQPALIMGCDLPHCPGEILQSAYNNLLAMKNIIGPTMDGGYYCIGGQRAHEYMFSNVDWGTPKVFTQTITSCSNCAIEFDLFLPELRDLDCYDDLVVISEYCPALKSHLI